MPQPGELLSGEGLELETGLENRLRPQSLDEFVGQDRIRKNLRVFIQAAESAASVWIMRCSTDPPVSGRPRSRM